MGGRATTNILLAIIAGVLLFGSAAVTGAIQWVAIIGGVLLFLYVVIAFALYLMRETVKALQESKALGRDFFPCDGFRIDSALMASGFWRLSRLAVAERHSEAPPMLRRIPGSERFGSES
jgi:hypothetical protein